MKQLNFPARAFVPLALLVLSLCTPVLAADDAASAEKRGKLIGILKSDAAPAEKAITCKELAIYGNKEAVPALAPLLADPKLTSWARIALEAIPGPEADAALRTALDQVKDRILVGVINSIAVRRDTKAVPGLVAKLKDANPDVASAAAEALGHIGGDDAAKALTESLSGAEALRSSAAYGCILCAENYLEQGKAPAATRLYESVRKSSAPRQRILEATRGAILAAGAQGLPLLLEQLRSSDWAFIGIGLRTARELPGAKVTEALAKELETAAADRQEPLFQALADRQDAAVLPKILQVAKSGPTPLRVLALGTLDRFRDPAAVGILLEGTGASDAAVAQAAKATLNRLGGKEVDRELVTRLAKASGKTAQALLDLCKQRHIVEALPAAVKRLDDSDAGVRRAALETVGALGSTSEASGLATRLTKTPDAKVRGDIEQALLAICGRAGAPCIPAVLPLMKNSDSGLRLIGVNALAAIGGNEAVAAVAHAVDDSDPAVQDEVVRALSEWSGNWPKDSGVAEPLLALAKSGKKPAYQVQGLRGYLKYIQENKELGNADKITKINAALPLMKRSEEKQLAISVLGTIPTATALDALASFTSDPATAETACMAITRLANSEQAKELPKDGLRKALEIAAKSTNETTRKQADAALKKLN
jgi:HEAT repeat protein